MTIILIIMAIALPLGIESRANCSDIEKMAKCINKEERERCIELNGGPLVFHKSDSEENLTNQIENLAYNCTPRCWKQHCFGPPKRRQEITEEIPEASPDAITNIPSPI